jgi:drug/metabolite transporter (DMT)-like permease
MIGGMLDSEKTQTPPPWWAYGCLALSMALVGSYVALSKPLVAALPVFLLAWLRFGIGGAAMLHWLKRPGDEAPLDTRTHALLFAESFFGNFLFSICMLYGMSMTSAVSAGVIMASIPAACAVLSWLLLRERVSGRVWLAVALAVVGIALVSLSKVELGMSEGRLLSAQNSQKQASEGLFGLPGAWLGNLLLIGAVLCEAIYAVVGKKLTGRMSAKRITALVNAWGFALMTPLGIWVALSFNFSTVPAPMWLLLVFYALAASVWTVWLWMTGLKHLPASRGGIFTVFLPISAAVVGVVALGETVSPMQWLAFSIALVGVVLATSEPTRKQD